MGRDSRQRLHRLPAANDTPLDCRLLRYGQRDAAEDVDLGNVGWRAIHVQLVRRVDDDRSNPRCEFAEPRERGGDSRRVAAEDSTEVIRYISAGAGRLA